MVAKPTSSHLHPRTATKLRALAILLSLAILAFGVYVTWLAFEILEFTRFNFAALVILMTVSVGIIIWFILITVQRKSFHREIEELKSYRIEHKIGARASTHPKRT